MSVTVNSSNTNEEINKILKSEKKELKFRKVGLENYKLLLQQKKQFQELNIRSDARVLHKQVL